MKNKFCNNLYYRKFKFIRAFHVYTIIPLLVYIMFTVPFYVTKKIEDLYLQLYIEPNISFTLGAIMVSLFITANLYNQDFF